MLNMLNVSSNELESLEVDKILSSRSALEIIVNFSLFVEDNGKILKFCLLEVSIR